MEHTNRVENLMTAVFRNRDDAENAYQELLKRGFSRDQINVLMSEEARTKHYGVTTETRTKAAEGAGYGAAVGGTTGAIVAAIAAIGTSLILPGWGLIIAGPLAAALAGAGAGGATGGALGALIGLGMDEETVNHYESNLREGNIVLGFTPRNSIEADEVEKIWKDYNGEHIIR